MKTKFFLYARKSTEDEERQVMSIEAQLAELAEFAKRENIEIAETFIESKSAKKPGREIFNQMMSKVHDSKEPIGLIAWHPDRLARNSIDGGQIIYSIDIGKIVSFRFPTFGLSQLRKVCSCFKSPLANQNIIPTICRKM